MRRCSCLFLACCSLSLTALADDAASPAYMAWKADQDLTIAQPLGGLKGDPVRGRKLAIAQAKGNCLACHELPIPEEDFHGQVAPSLHGVASRYKEGEIRMRVVNIQEINPLSLMPPMYKQPAEFKQVAGKFVGHTVLTAQEVEDVVAYLMTLK
jgi:sulfur-oxidizing protein SoxX